MSDLADGGEELGEVSSSDVGSEAGDEDLGTMRKAQPRTRVVCTRVICEGVVCERVCDRIERDRVAGVVGELHFHGNTVQGTSVEFPDRFIGLGYGVLNLPIKERIRRKGSVNLPDYI